MTEEKTKRVQQGFDPTGARHVRILIDAGWAVLLAYGVGLIFIFIAKGFELWHVGNALFLFLLAFFFPWIAITVDPMGLLYISLFGLLFYGVVRYSPSKTRPFTLAVALLGWEVYGLYCVNLVAP